MSKIEDMTPEQQQAAEQYLQLTAMVAKKLVDSGMVKQDPGTGAQRYYSAYARIEEAINACLDILVQKLGRPNVAELAAVLSGLIGKVIAEASTMSKGPKAPVTEDMFNSLEKMFGAGVRITTMEAQRLAQSNIVLPKGSVH